MAVINTASNTNFGGLFDILNQRLSEQRQADALSARLNPYLPTASGAPAPQPQSGGVLGQLINGIGSGLGSLFGAPSTTPGAQANSSDGQSAGVPSALPGRVSGGQQPPSAGPTAPPPAPLAYVPTLPGGSSGLSSLAAPASPPPALPPALSGPSSVSSPRAVAYQASQAGSPQPTMSPGAPSSGPLPSFTNIQGTSPATGPGRWFNGLEQKFNLPQGYLASTMAIEDPSGDPNATSSTGAKGPFQFTKGTAAQYGLTDPTNFGASAYAAAQLASDNANQLRQALGRDPTGPEIYLAHQQGAKTAAALINNPNVPAGQVLASIGVSPRNIAVNGGDPSAPAGQFTSMWASKFGQPGAIGGTGAPGQTQIASAQPGSPFGSLMGPRAAVGQDGGLPLMASAGVPGLSPATMAFAPQSPSSAVASAPPPPPAPAMAYAPQAAPVAPAPASQAIRTAAPDWSPYLKDDSIDMSAVPAAAAPNLQKFIEDNPGTVQVTAGGPNGISVSYDNQRSANWAAVNASRYGLSVDPKNPTTIGFSGGTSAPAGGGSPASLSGAAPSPAPSPSPASPPPTGPSIVNMPAAATTPIARQITVTPDMIRSLVSDPDTKDIGLELFKYAVQNKQQPVVAQAGSYMQLPNGQWMQFPTKPDQTDDIKNYNYSVGQGYGGTLQDYRDLQSKTDKAQLVEVPQPDGRMVKMWLTPGQVPPAPGPSAGAGASVGATASSTADATLGAIGAPYTKTPSVAIDQRAETSSESEFGKAVGKDMGDTLTAGSAAPQGLQQVAMMRAAAAQAGNSLSTGPFAQGILKGKEAIGNALGIEIPGTSAAEVINNLGFGLATQAVRAISNRPTQFEFGQALAVKPGLAQSPQGFQAVLNIKQQDLLDQQNLARLLADPANRGPQWPQVKAAYYAAHPIMSPFDPSRPLGQADVDALQAASASAPPPPGVPQGARQGNDGAWYVPDPSRAGKWMKVNR